MNNKVDLSVQAFDYVQLAFSKFHNHQVNSYIKLDGKIQMEILQRAVNLTTYDLPQLVCKFSKGEYYKAENILKVELIKTNSVDEKVDEAMSKSIDMEKGPQARIVVIREDKRDTIVVVMSHLLCDGMSIKRYIYLICSYYNKLLNGSAISHPYEGKKRDLEWLKQCELPKDIKSRKEKVKEQLKFSAGDINLFAKIKIEPKYYTNIKSYIKKKNVTMNDLFIAIYYKAVWKVFNYPLSSICCVMDLRRYIDDKDSYGLCNQTGNAFTTIKNSESMSFEELLQEVHIQMNNEKEKGLCLKQIRILNKAFSILPHSISKRIIKICISNPQVALTNLGEIEKHKITFKGLETLECFILPSLKKASNFQLAVSTFEGNILLIVNMIVCEEGKEKIYNYLRIYKQILEEVVSSSGN